MSSHVSFSVQIMVLEHWKTSNSSLVLFEESEINNVPLLFYQKLNVVTICGSEPTEKPEHKYYTFVRVRIPGMFQLQ